MKLRIEQIRKLNARKDYAGAMAAADEMDWRRCKDVKALSEAAEAYVQGGRYSDAIDLLLQAYEFAPNGRRIIYRLTEIAILAGDAAEAKSYYEEFVHIAPNDMGRYLLQYQVAKLTGASVEELIGILEEHQKLDFDERWAYELAELYHLAGRSEECVKLCDDIILWFGLGTYVEKAMALKVNHRPLSASQQEHSTNPEKFQEQLRRVEEEFRIAEEEKGPAPEPDEPLYDENAVPETKPAPDPEYDPSFADDEDDDEYDSDDSAGYGSVDGDYTGRLPGEPVFDYAELVNPEAVIDEMERDTLAELPRLERGLFVETALDGQELYDDEDEDNLMLFDKPEVIHESHTHTALYRGAKLVFVSGEKTLETAERTREWEDLYDPFEEDDIRGLFSKTNAEIQEEREQALREEAKRLAEEEEKRAAAEAAAKAAEEAARAEAEAKAAEEATQSAADIADAADDAVKAAVEAAAVTAAAAEKAVEVTAIAADDAEKTAEEAAEAVKTAGETVEDTAKAADDAEKLPSVRELEGSEWGLPTEDVENDLSGLSDIFGEEISDEGMTTEEKKAADEWAAAEQESVVLPENAEPVQADAQDHEIEDSLAAAIAALEADFAADPVEGMEPFVPVSAQKSEPAQNATPAAEEQGEAATNEDSETGEQTAPEDGENPAADENTAGEEIAAEDAAEGAEEAEAAAVETPAVPEKRVYRNILIRTSYPDRGVKMALEILKGIPEDERPSSVAKTTGEKLEEKGIRSSMELLKERVLVVVEAGYLDEEVLEDIRELIEAPDSHCIVVLIDTSENIGELCLRAPELSKLFENDYDYYNYSEDDLVSHASDYAESKGFAIDDMALLVLFNKVGQFVSRPDGTEWIKTEQIIDNAIAKATKKGLFRFGPKVDKDGKKILKESHFS